jgi:glycosyltransferase involved in cell wall biosynthesis
MKIAIFYNLPASGAKRAVYEHIKGLRKLGHSVDVYTTDTDTFFNIAEVASNVYIYQQNFLLDIPFFTQIGKDINTFIITPNLHKRIASDIDKNNYDITLIHTDIITQAPFILRFLKTKSVYFCLEPLKIAYEYQLRISDSLGIFHRFHDTVQRFLLKKIDRENALRANFTTAISLFGRELMIQAYNVYPKISYLGVDTNVFKSIPMKKKNQILFIGQKIPMNGYHLALRAIEMIPQSMRPVLKAVSWTKNKHERLSDEALVKLYNESLITVSLSTFDTFGLVTLESLACGTPVIAHNVAGYRETMIQGKTGFLVDFSPSDIAKKIVYLLENREKARKMGEFGKKWVHSHWTWTKHIKELEKLLFLFINDHEKH